MLFKVLILTGNSQPMQLWSYILILISILEVANGSPKKYTQAKNSTKCNIIARYFYHQQIDSTSCPHETWLEKFRDVDPAPDKNIINIGFNKGYNFALFTSLWTQNNVDVKMWYDALVEIGIDDCGQCFDCTARILNPTAKNQLKTGTTLTNSSLITPLVLVGVELQQRSVRNVRRVINKFMRKIPSWNSSVHIHTIHAAGSNRVGEIWVHRCGYKGTNEWCSIVSDLILEKRNATEIAAKFDSIPVLTVDSLVTELIANNSLNIKQYHRHKSSIHNNRALSPPVAAMRGHGGVVIDILMIDTEGYDALVLEGAKKTLHSCLVRMIVFEYHSVCPWAESSLESVVQMLAALSYDCYFEGNARVWRLTDCWDPLWELRFWSNVLCLKRGDIWHQIIEDSFVVSYEVAAAGLAGANTTGDEFRPKPNDQLPCSKNGGMHLSSSEKTHTPNSLR